ncbi:hypothetical protein ACP70R_034497 [Stipagrostis hirtigluma subsp. patula]
MASPARSSDNKGDKPSGLDDKKATAAAASGPGSGAEAPAPAREGMTRLPRMDVVNFLARDPLSIAPYDAEYMFRFVQEARPNVPEAVQRAVAAAVAESYNEGMREKVVVFQDWVWGQLEEKGYVDVPDQFIRDREDVCRRLVIHMGGIPCVKQQRSMVRQLPR